MLQKLPFTIPELVQSSPCRSSDGVLYTGMGAQGHGAGWGSRDHGGAGPAQRELLGTGRAAGAYKESIFLLLSGKKQDTWFVVDPKSGEKQTTLSTEAWDGLCPSSPLLYIGRTRKPVPCPQRLPGARNGALEVTSCPVLSLEYVITMYDTKSRELRWNATFSEYSAPLCEESYHYSEWNCSSHGSHGSCDSPVPTHSGTLAVQGPGVTVRGPAGLCCAHCWGEQAAAHGWWQN